MILSSIYYKKSMAISVHYDSVNRSTTISGFSQIVKNIFILWKPTLMGVFC